MKVAMHLSTITLVFLGLTGPARGAEPNAVVGPVEVARLWLEALRAGDLASFRQLSTLPITIKGFNLESGPKATECGGKPRTDGLVGVRSFDPGGGSGLVASDEIGFESAFRCLRQDNFLIHYIPQSSKGFWPRDRKDSRDGNVGEMRLLKDARPARRLGQQYKRDIRQLLKTDFAVQARMTDNNGVTNHVLIVVTPVPPGPILKVRAAYIDELFEE